MNVSGKASLHIFFRLNPSGFKNGIIYLVTTFKRALKKSAVVLLFVLATFKTTLSSEFFFVNNQHLVTSKPIAGYIDEKLVANLIGSNVLTASSNEFK